MKVIQILPELNEGGVERGTVDLNREFVKRGIQSIVISNGGKLVPQITKDGGIHVQVDVCSKNPLTAPWRIWHLYKEIKKLSPDILHVRSRVPAWMVYFANKALKLPIVSTVHGFNSVSFYSSIMTKADRVICVSNAIKEFVCKEYSFDYNKIVLIPRGVDLENFNPSKLDCRFIQDFKVQYNLQSKLIVSSVGRITQLKDYETFIKAIKQLSISIPNIVGLIVGGVRDDKEMYLQSLQKISSENIVFTGSVNKIAEIYALSDVVVSSSKKPESFGRSVAEALAIGTPVVATGHGGVKDIIKNDINGYFFEAGNIEELCKKILKAKDLNFDGYKYILHTFSLAQMVEGTIKTYEELI